MILVTGATGMVGGELVDQLLQAGEKFRVLARDPSKLERLKGRVEIAQGDLGNLESLKTAMAGVDHVFLLTVDQGTVTDANVIEAAKAAGVRHVVKLSTNFVVNEPQTAIGRWHAQKEKLLMDSGLAWTMLRPGAFMSNSLQWLRSIKSQGAVFIATGDTKSAPIDPVDIAAVAKVALTQAGHEGKAYELSGVDLLDGREQVEVLAKVLGRPIKVIPVTVAAAMEGMRSNPAMSAAMVEARGEMLEAIRSGKLDRKATDTVLQLTKRQAGTFSHWCEAHKGAFV
jgi:(4-alkanoyl-5-oxo-2,5-dihydrofuran-3-yl)methyl phosphate reductase